jgi:Spy/CpxP family protein refolding chaperone
MKRRTWLAALAVTVMGLVAGATVLTGARALAQWPGGPGMHGGAGMSPGPGMTRGHGMFPGHRMDPGMMRRRISTALDEGLNQASVTPEQRVAIHASRDRAFAALDAQRPDPRAHRDQVLAVFEGDYLDAGQLQALHAQMEQQHEAVRKAITQAIVEIHNTLTPAQRKIVADYVRAHGPMAGR